MAWTQPQQHYHEEALMMCPPPTELTKRVYDHSPSKQQALRHRPLQNEEERAFWIPPAPLPPSTESPFWWQVNMTIMTNTTYGDLLEDEDYDDIECDYTSDNSDSPTTLFGQRQQQIYQHMSLVPTTKYTRHHHHQQQRDVHEMFSRLQSSCCA